MKAKQLLWKLSLVFVSMLFVLATAFGLLNVRETKTVKASGEAVSVYMLDGASIRYDGENSGIRFTAYVSESSFTAGTDVTVGMTIATTEKTWERTSKADTWQWATSDVAGYKKFQVALTGIPATDYGTELTATAWVDVDGVKTDATAQTRSIARVANACLAENELLKELGSEEVLTDTKVSTLDGYTTGEALASVSSIEMHNNSFAWSEVTGATGYFVGFSGEVAHVTSGASIPVSAFGKIATPVDGVSVIAYGNGVDSTYGDVVSGNVLLTELATFTDKNNGTLVNISGYQWTDYKAAPVYANGTATAAFYIDRYHEDGGSTNLAAFKVVLPTGLDLTKDGIVVKALLADYSNISGATPDKFTLLTKDGQKTWQTTEDITTFPNVTMPTDTVTYMELKVSSAQLEALGYATGDTVLYFGGWYTATAQKNLGVSMKFQLDYISYYSEGFSLETPADLTVSTKGLITWSEVSNADKYIVEIDGTEYETTANRYQMEEFTADVTVRVRAISNGEYWSASLWSETIATDHFTLEKFNSADSTGRVVAGHPDDSDNTAINKVFHTAVPTPTFDATKGDDGAVFIRLNHSTIGESSRSLIFAVNLAKGLDFTNNQGITVRLAVQWISGSNGANAYLAVGNVGAAGDSYKTAPTDESKAVPVPSNESVNFVTIQFTAAELAALGYTDGRTTITFCLWSAKAAVYQGSAGIWLDEISYYRLPTLETPENVTVSDKGLIEWSEVTNADGYVVEIDGTEYTSNTNSYQIQAFAKDVTVRVRAISNGEYWSASPWTEEVTTKQFTLATFTDENNGTVDYVEANRNNKYREGPSYADGAVKVAVYLDNYDVTSNAGSALSAYKVNLSNGLNLSKDGIVVSFNVYDKSSALNPDTFTLLKKGDNANWCLTDKTTLPGVAVTYQTAQELKITSAQLRSMGYADGDTELYFGVWNSEAMNITMSYAMWVQFDEILHYVEYTVDELVAQIAYDDTQEMELGAYIAPTSAILTNWNATAYNANNIYQAAGLNSFNMVVDTSSTFADDVETDLTRCGWASIDTYIQLHYEMTTSVDGWTAFQKIFNGVDLTEYPALKGFFIADEPSWAQMEIIETYYVPWFNENYAKSGLEFCVNLLGGYSTAIGELRDIDGNSLGGRMEGSEEEYRACHTAYVNEWLRIFSTVQSSNKHLTLDSYPLMDNQTGLLSEFNGSLPEGYERVLYEDWLRRSMNMANFARDNGLTFGAFIQAFDEGGEGSTRTYRLPTTVAEIKWQAYMNIALGAKRLTYYGFDGRAGGHYMTAGAQPTPIYDLVQQTNAELATLDHVFMAFDTWVGAKTFIPNGATASTAIAGVADIELEALTNVSGVTTSGELLVGEMVDNHGNHGYMLVGYNDPYDGVSTSVDMTFDGADGFIVYRAGETVRTFVKSADGALALTLGAGEGVFVIPVYAD